jgi:hypothetical protein
LQTYATYRWNTCNRRMKHLKTYAYNMHVYATSRSILQHPDENTCSIHLIQMKHLEHTLQRYVHSHCNMCNILIYFYNIPIYFCNTDTKHFAMHLWNICLQHNFSMQHLLAALE